MSRGDCPVTRSDRSGCGLKPQNRDGWRLFHCHPLRSERVWIETAQGDMMLEQGCVTRSDRSGCGLKHDHPRWSITVCLVTRSDRSGCGLKHAMGRAWQDPYWSPAPIGAGVD